MFAVQMELMEGLRSSKLGMLSWKALALEVFGLPWSITQRCLTNSLWAVAKLGLRGEDC